MLTLEAAIQSVLDELDTLPQDWHEEGIPEFDNLHYVAGVLKPYFVVSFGDITQGFGRSFAGTRGDDHDLPVRFMAVAPTAKIARQLRTKITDVFTGFAPDYCGELVKRGGGGLFTVTNDNGAVVAYVAPIGFRTSLTLFEVA